MFITIEGPDGSGKTTVINYLKAKLPELVIDNEIIFTREPGGTEFGNEIRNLLLNNENIGDIEEVYLFAASRASHVKNLIKPSLKKGYIVVSDRFLDSSIAYQGFGRKLGRKVVEQINEAALQRIVPDLTIYLSLSPQIGIERIQKNRTDELNRLDNENMQFYQRVVEGYNDLIASDNGNRYVSIDATQSPEKVRSDVLNAVLKKLGIESEKNES